MPIVPSSADNRIEVQSKRDQLTFEVDSHDSVDTLCLHPEKRPQASFFFLPSP